MSSLAGKVAIVTGSSQGIGAGIAERLAADGASVVVNYSRSVEHANAVVQRIVASGGKAVAVRADVSKPVARPTRMPCRSPQQESLCREFVA